MNAFDGSNVLKLEFPAWHDELPENLTEINAGAGREPRGKKRGQKSEVFAYDPEDMTKMISYFEEHGKWIHYLLFTFQVCSARRVGDLIGYTNKETGKSVSGLYWSDLFDPSTGKFRSDIRSFCEQKTGKLASPRINDAMRDAVVLYCEKTGCDPSVDNYGRHVFLQLSGTHKGRVLSYSAAQAALKDAAASCGIEYNVGTHSARKAFGATTKLLHPGDSTCMEALQSYYNHSSSAITNRYIGLTKKQTDGYVDDIGEFFTEYVVGGKEIPLSIGSPVMTVDTNALIDLIKQAYLAGKNSDGTDDASAIFDLVRSIATIKK